VANVLEPVFLVLFWKRHVNRWPWFGVAIAFIGLFLLTVPPSDAGALFHFADLNRGDLLTIGCAITFALQIILVGRATQRFPASQVAVVQIAAVALIMAVTSPLMETPRIVWSAQVLWAIAVTGILCTAVAFSVQSWAQQYTPPTHTALIFLLEPVAAWVTSYIVLHERLGFRAGVGALLILGGVLLSEWKGGVTDSTELRAEVGA
jgi:drug/metabolite transporter (DMT)-like permease